MPDISKWNTINIKSLGGLFYKCKNLEILTDISKWNTTNVFDLSLLFYECSSLKELPHISKWNMNNAINLKSLFFNCSSLMYLPDISKWNIFNSNINNYLSFLNSVYDFQNETNIRKAFKNMPNLNDKLENDLYLGNIDFQILKPKSYIKGDIINFFLNASYSINSLFADVHH